MTRHNPKPYCSPFLSVAILVQVWLKSQHLSLNQLSGAPSPELGRLGLRSLDLSGNQLSSILLLWRP